MQSGNLAIYHPIQITSSALPPVVVYIIDIYGRQQRNTKSIYTLTYKKAIYANIEKVLKAIYFITKQSKEKK